MNCTSVRDSLRAKQKKMKSSKHSRQQNNKCSQRQTWRNQSFFKATADIGTGNTGDDPVQHQGQHIRSFTDFYSDSTMDYSQYVMLRLTTTQKQVPYFSNKASLHNVYLCFLNSKVLYASAYLNYPYFQRPSQTNSRYFTEKHLKQ